jgi:hypothetical protein
MITQSLSMLNPAAHVRKSSQLVRSMAAIGLITGMFMVAPAYPALAALDHGSLRSNALINHRGDIPVRPRVERQGRASKDARRASQYAKIRRQSANAASTSRSRAFFR